jgi:hypothetical protein
MHKEIALKNWILEAIQNRVYSERLEKNDLFLWRNDEKIKGILFRYHFQYKGVLHAQEGILRDAFDYITPSTYALFRNPEFRISYNSNKLIQLSKDILAAIKTEGKFELQAGGKIKAWD